MRAARYHGKEDIRIEEIPTVKCGQGQIKIKPAFVGICGTDLHEFLGGPTFSPTSPHPVTGETVPIGMGHEFSGTIAEIGPGVSDSSFHVGQKVAIQPSIYCGSCGACKNGIENACPKGGFIGLSGGGGGLSEEVVVPAEAVLPLPSNVNLDIALVEPLSVAWHAVSASPLSTLDASKVSVLILGGGPIGLAVLQVLLALSAPNILVSEVASQRQAFARDFGAHHVIDPVTADVVAKARELSEGGDGPDIVFDCAGVPASLEAACKSVRSRGTVVNVAIWEKAVPFNPNLLVFKEARYVGVLGYQRADFVAVIAAIGDGRLKPESMITSKIKMDDLVEKGIWALVREKDKHVKILVDVNAR